MFWNRKHKKPVPECPASDTAVYLCPSGFYFDEKPIHPSCQMLSLYPHEIIEGDPTFLAFAARVNTPTLVTRMPEYEHWLYECEFYAYREELSNAQVQTIANDLRSSEFALRIFYHSCHDYLLIETAEDTLTCIKHIQELCSQEGRTIFH